MSHRNRLLILAAGVGALAVSGFALAAGVTVELTGSGPNPADVTASLGDTVTFTNSYVVPYVVSSPGLAFTSPSIPPGGTFEHVVTKVGSFAFFQVGPPRTVRGSIRVVRAGSVTLAAPGKAVRFGEGMTLTGTSSLPAFPVLVQHLPAGERAWQDLMTVTPAADGSFVALVQPEKTTAYRAGTLGNQLVSPLVRVAVRPKLTLRATPRKALEGRRVAVVMRVTPPGAAKVVDLMRYNPKWRAWTRLATRPLSAETGAARFVWRLEAGSNRLQARIFWRNLSPGYAESTSAVITVKGVPDKTPKRRR